MKYEVLEKDRFKYVSLVLLNEIINFQHYFTVKPVGEEVFIEPYLSFMKTKGVLEVKNGKYIPTALGREELVNLYAKYYEYLKLYDIFCAVDLEAGEFAFSSMNDEFTDDEWNVFISDERFSDIRVSVAEFKGLDPLEIVFMSFLNEGRFDVQAPRWENSLTGSEIWTEISEICSSAISKDYLNEDDVLENVITQGSVIAIDLVKQANDSINDLNDGEYDDNDDYEETVTVTEYVDIVEEPYYDYDYDWDPYYDPYYVSPLWLVPVVLLF